MTTKQVLDELKKFDHYQSMSDYQIKKEIGGQKLAVVAELQDALKKEQRKQKRAETSEPKTKKTPKSETKTKSEKVKSTKSSESETKTKKTPKSETKKPKSEKAKSKSTKSSDDTFFKPLKYETCYIFTIWTEEEIRAGYEQAENTFVVKEMSEIGDVFQRYMYENKHIEVAHNNKYRDDEPFALDVEHAMFNLPVINNLRFITAARTDLQSAKMILK